MNIDNTLLPEDDKKTSEMEFPALVLGQGSVLVSRIEVANPNDPTTAAPAILFSLTEDEETHDTGEEVALADYSIIPVQALVFTTEQSIDAVISALQILKLDMVVADSDTKLN